MFRFITTLLLAAGLCAAQSEGPRDAPEQALTARLQQDPNNLPALLELGSLKMEDSSAAQGSLRLALLDDAQGYFERVVSIDFNNTAALFKLGVIGWTRVFPELRTARAQLAMDPETPGPLRDAATRAVLTAKYGQTLRNSVEYLERVLSIDPQNNDSMAYLNLVYRAKADLEETPDAYRADIATADQWVQRTLATVRARHEAGTLNQPMAPPPPPPPPPYGSPATPTRIRVGGNVQAANLIRKVDPVYPEMALRARIQGTVKFNAVIGKDGAILNLTVISGHPMLVQAALEAVKQYLYKPTQLNGEPVEVITDISVDFRLP